MNLQLKAFVRGIHAAISSANDALADKNLEVLNTYFEPVASDEPSDRVDAAIEAARRLVADHVIDSGAGERVQGIFDALREALGESDGGARRSSASLRPRMVSIQYPEQTADGVRLVDVNVPLITLVPVTQSRIDSVTLRSTIDLSVDPDDELRVGFSAPTVDAAGNDGMGKGTAPAGTATLEITLRPNESSEGLKRLIEGYERVLRAQIPG